MALPGIPQNFYVQQGNRQVFLSWDLAAGATSYQIQRSTDNITFSNLATVTTPSYLDTAVTTGTTYYYQVASVSTGGTSPYTPSQSVVPTPTAEMSLGQLRLSAQQRADRVNSNFVTVPEWNSYINQSMYELYDLLITVYEDYFVTTPAQFSTDGNTYLYQLPDGVTVFQNGVTGLDGYVAPPFYKLMGVDLAVQTANNAWVTMDKFNFMDRNRFVYPNTASTIYGVFNMQYRLLGDKIEFIPTPSARQLIRIWYIPRLNQLLQDNDLTTTSISGWIEYVIVDAAIKALQKEESDGSVLMVQKQALMQRIQDSAMNRDAGRPDRITDVRQNRFWGDAPFGYNGPNGGFIVTPPLSLGYMLPSIASYNIANHGLTHSILSSQGSLANIALSILTSYISYLSICKLSSWISSTKTSDSIANSTPSFFSHICHIIARSSKKEMIRSHASRVITFMTNIQRRVKSAVSQLVTKPVSSNTALSCKTPLVNASARINEIDKPVSQSITLTSPFPTIRTDNVLRPLFIDLIPKTHSYVHTIYYNITKKESQ